MDKPDYFCYHKNGFIRFCNNSEQRTDKSRGLLSVGDSRKRGD